MSADQTGPSVSCEKDRAGIMKNRSSREILAIPLGKIKMACPRARIDEDHALMIAASMTALGPVTPVEVHEPDGSGHYLLVAGHHRYRAAQLAGIACLPAVLRGPEPEPACAAAWDGNFPIRQE